MPISTYCLKNFHCEGNLKTTKPYTAGLQVATGNHAVGPDIIDWQTAKQEKDNCEAAAKVQKSYERDTEFLGKVMQYVK